jgi:hypothetical protein
MSTINKCVQNLYIKKELGLLKKKKHSDIPLISFSLQNFHVYDCSIFLQFQFNENKLNEK